MLLADLYTPLGVAVWVMYLIPLALSLLASRPQIPLAVAAVSTLLMGVTLFSDEPGDNMQLAQVNRACGIFTIWIMAGVAFYFVKNKIAIELERWIQKGQTSLNKMMVGDPQLGNLGDIVLKHLTEYLGGQASLFYSREGSDFRRIASYGVPADSNVRKEFTLDDGLLGRAVKDSRIFVVSNVPDGYVTVGSGLGEGKPRNLVICPMRADNITYAVLELGFLGPVDHRTELLLERVSESVATAVRSANYRAHLQALLEETQRQSEELQAQSEELRVANEELEEQGNALKETAARLELQQAELEQTNSQLEEQTQLLETQRDNLANNQRSLEHQANELEQASRYKSEFLANMSHELRTPLNSSLILAKLLADNPKGNLTEEQVKFAKTIQSSGNDLLNLISDILDLSKIEAGQMEIRLEEMRLGQLIEEVSRTMRPLAEQKSLSFEATIAGNCPATLTTDRQRLEQILKNLLSNAIKFTEKGEVKLEVTQASDGRLALVVSDTGIGISPEQQQVVFEAFRQADSSAHRKHGGTGLGLSISKEFAHLLGGELRLQSEPGKGSAFTLLIPVELDPADIPNNAGNIAPKVKVTTVEPLPIPPEPAPTTSPSSGASERRLIDDDRDDLTDDSRVILVVEDDANFARILYDMARDVRFQCVVASTAQEAYNAAIEYRPSAVILDIGLPDHSGLSVLDRLKNDARVRHIPVHVISGSEYADSALSLGAVGFMLKPVKREEIMNVLKGLESRLDQRMRRVLVVEDDEVQLDSLHALLGSRDVETVGVRSAAACLEKLRGETFDCMVLDLTLPDASGYSLLETLSQEEAYSFPPVIVYTGRALTLEEEQRLLKYSKSIIIKGAKSPERLLDEVTLFLHQVVAELPPEQQKMIEKARSRDAALENRHILIVEDDVRNVFALTSILEPCGVVLQVARNGLEAIAAIDKSLEDPTQKIDLVLMDVMMPEMDGIAATKEIRKRPKCNRLPILMLTAKAMQDDQQNCLDAGANDYLAKPLDVDKLLSLIRVWMPRQGTVL